MDEYKMFLKYLEGLPIDELVKSVTMSMELRPNNYNISFTITLNIKIGNSTVELLTVPDLLENYDNVSSYLSIVYYRMYNGINRTFQKQAQNNSLGNYLMKKHSNLSDEWRLYEKAETC